MFDFEEEIGEWRRSLEVAFGGPAQAIDELECHLREDFESFTAAGIPPDTAFGTAREKLGKPDRLASEFIGVVPTKIWMPACNCLLFPMAFIAMEFWMAYASGALGGISWFWRIRLVSISVGYAFSFYSLIVGLVFVAFRALRPFGLEQVRFVGRMIAWSNLVTAVTLAIGWVMNFYVGSLKVGGSPSLVEFPFVMGLTAAWFAVPASLWRLSTRWKQLSIPLSMFGSTFVVFEWFLRIHWATTMAMDGTRSYGFGPPTGIIVALTFCSVLPILGFSLAMLPAGVLKRRMA